MKHFLVIVMSLMLAFTASANEPDVAQKDGKYLSSAQISVTQNVSCNEINEVFVVNSCTTSNISEFSPTSTAIETNKPCVVVNQITAQVVSYLSVPVGDLCVQGQLTTTNASLDTHTKIQFHLKNSELCI